MSITAAQLIARVSVEGADAAQGKLLGLGAAADSTTAHFRNLAVIGSGVVVAGLLAVGAISVKMAGDFQQAVIRLRTGAGDTQDSFNSLAKGILGVSVATGVMTGPLSQAMYLILSSGQRGAQAMNTLSAAAKGAQIEQASVVDVSNTLSGVMTNFGTHTFGATQYMNGLITAVANGKVTLQDLSVAMGPLEPLARTVGVSFQDLSAAMSTQTNAMIPAERAATGLRFMFQALEAPTKKAKDAMASLGLDSVKVAQEMRVSLPDALQMVVNAAKKAGPEGSVPFNRALSDMVGGARGLMSFLALTGPHMAEFRADIAKISASMSAGQKDVIGWDLAQQGFNITMDKVKATVAAAAIGIGLALLPALTRLMGVIPQVVAYFMDFGNHANVLVPILAGIGAIILGLLVPAVIALAAGVIAATWPILAIGAAVAGLVAIFMHLYSTNAGFKAFIDNLVNGFRTLWSIIQANLIPTIQRLGTFFQGTILPVLRQIGAFLVGTFRPAWEQLVTTWNTNLLPALKMLWSLFQTLLPVLKVVGMIILGVVVVALVGLVVAIVLVLKWVALLIQGWSLAISFLGKAFSALGATITNFKNLVGNIFSAIGATITNFKNMVGAVFSAIGATFNNFRNLVGSVFSAIGAWFPWLYNHNIYIKALVDLAVAAFNALRANVGAVFSAIGSVMNNLRNVAGAVFSAIGATVNNFRGLVGSAFSAIGSAISGAMSSATGSVRSFGSNALGAIGSFVGGAISAIGGLVSQIAGYLGGLAGQAFQWGANLLGSFASGIWSAIGGVVAAAQSAMSQVAGILGFHSPAKEGPGRDADTWAPNLMKMFAAGIVAGTPDVQRALTGVLAPLATTLSVGAIGSSPPTFAAGSALARSITGSTGGGAGGSSAPPVINVYLDGAPVAKKLMPHIVQQIRSATGVKF